MAVFTKVATFIKDIPGIRMCFSMTSEMHVVLQLAKSHCDFVYKGEVVCRVYDKLNCAREYTRIYCYTEPFAKIRLIKDYM